MSTLMRNDIRFSLLLLHNYIIKFISISLLAEYYMGDYLEIKLKYSKNNIITSILVPEPK